MNCMRQVVVLFVLLGVCCCLHTSETLEEKNEEETLNEFLTGR